MALPTIFPVTCHTDHVGPGSTFVAIQGYQQDGRRFISQACKRGATRIILQVEKEETRPILKEDELVDPTAIARKAFIKNNIEYLYVDDSRKALAILAAQAVGNPERQLKIIGVTGTKGKTTTAFLIEHILQTAGFKTALLGSIFNRIGTDAVRSRLTTMASDELSLFFNECVKQKVAYVVMEVSAHAISLHRTYGISFDGICFTNLAAEHLDFYHTLENYFTAKCQIFSQIKPEGFRVINTGDIWGKKIKHMFRASQGISSRATFFFSGKDVADGDTLLTLQHSSMQGLRFTLTKANKKTLYTCPLLFGTFNAENLAMAILTCERLGVDANIVRSAVNVFSGVPGRLQRHVLRNAAIAFVDYAHNASSLAAVLGALRPLSRHLIVVFGCGGDRDSEKRSEMGKIAASFGDYIILTSDNPRSEDPMHIVEEILHGIPLACRQNVKVVLDRKKAIAQAASISNIGSIIALLGKGHETSMLVGKKQVFLNDFETISHF